MVACFAEKAVWSDGSTIEIYSHVGAAGHGGEVHDKTVGVVGHGSGTGCPGNNTSPRDECGGTVGVDQRGETCGDTGAPVVAKKGEPGSGVANRAAGHEALTGTRTIDAIGPEVLTQGGAPRRTPALADA